MNAQTQRAQLSRRPAYSTRVSLTRNQTTLFAMIRDQKEQSPYGFFEKPFWLEARGGSKT
jgi:hypothetical protein